MRFLRKLFFHEDLQTLFREAWGNKISNSSSSNLTPKTLLREKLELDETQQKVVATLKRFNKLTPTSTNIDEILFLKDLETILRQLLTIYFNFSVVF